MPVVLQIALGGAIGASLRYTIVSFVTRLVGPGFPWGTMLVNIAGCFAIGVAATILIQRADPAWQRFAPFVVPGVLGGFTTFSAFTLESFQLIERGRMVLALMYIGGSVLLGLVALLLAITITRVWISA